MSLFGSILGAVSNIFGAKKGSDAQEDAIERQIAWQKEQLQTKHQWEVEDLKKAGLNPILSAHGSSSAASVSPGSLVNPLSGLASSAAELGKLKSDIAKNKADISNQTKSADAAVKNAESNMITAKSNRALADANVVKLNQDVQNSIAATAADIKYKEDQTAAYNRLVDGQIANGAIMANAAASQADAAWHNAHSSSAKAAKEIENLDSQIKSRLGDIAKGGIVAEARRRNPDAYIYMDALKSALDVINPFSSIFSK